MKWITRYITSLLPLSFIGGGILLSEWVFKTLECTTNGKEFSPCFALDFNVTSVLVIGMYWFTYLLPVVWFISIPWFVYVIICHVEYILKQRPRT
jgi:hypothetical protein|nr:hypothetical protein [uncultured Undibacterium sp.]